jgi:L-asparaginase II
VRRILAGAGLDESFLRNPRDYPLDDQARATYIRAGYQPAAVAMNCSGKHAAMLATCVANGWPLDSYVAPNHPLQTALAETFTALTGEPIVSTGVDGCGAPLFATSLVGLAGAFRTLVRAAAGTAEHRVAAAFAAHPTFASGTRRDEAALLTAVPGALAKAGAEACYAVALPDGRTVALKIDDGAYRARAPVMAAALRRLGVDQEAEVDGPALNATGVAVLRGGGRPVGELRVVHPMLGS